MILAEIHTGNLSMQTALLLEEIHKSRSLDITILRLELRTDYQFLILKKELRSPREIDPDIQFPLGFVKLHLLNDPGQINPHGLAEQLLGSKHLTWV
jgi:hypothetical protein